MHWKGVYLLQVLWYNGCVMNWGLSGNHLKWSSSPPRLPIMTGSISCPPSLVWELRTGISMPAVPLGISRGTNAGHLARAALEGIAYQTMDVLHAMEADSGIRIKELRVDGGAAANDTLMQFQSDILRAPVVRPQILETTALGAAYLAGLAVGVWDSQEEVNDQWKVDKTFENQRSSTDVKKLQDGWHRAVKTAKAWSEDR